MKYFMFYYYAYLTYICVFYNKENCVNKMYYSERQYICICFMYATLGYINYIVYKLLYNNF